MLKSRFKLCVTVGYRTKETYYFREWSKAILALIDLKMSYDEVAGLYDDRNFLVAQKRLIEGAYLVNIGKRISESGGKHERL